MRLTGTLAVVATLLVGCSSNWKMKETKSEMDDSVRYSVVTESEREQKTEKGEAIHAFLAITFEKNVTTIRSAPGQLIKFSGRAARLEGARVETGLVKVRFDEDEPIQADLIEMPNSNGRYAYLGPESELLRQMLKHKVMKVQWVLEFSEGSPVDTFKLDGLKGALVKICEKAPLACKSGTPIGGALASVGVEIAGASKTEPTSSAPTPSPSDSVALASGEYTATSAEWTLARDAVVAWCKSASNRCTDQVIQHLLRPSGGKLLVPGRGDREQVTLLSTWEPASGEPGALAGFQPAGGRWKVYQVEWITSSNSGAAAQIALAPGTFPATTAEWQKARDAVVVWCGANAGKCTEQAVDDLKKPADGVLTVGAGAEATLTTCSPGNCPGATFVEFKKAGTAWNVTKVEWSPMGD